DPHRHLVLRSQDVVCLGLLWGRTSHRGHRDHRETGREKEHYETEQRRLPRVLQHHPSALLSVTSVSSVAKSPSETLRFLHRASSPAPSASGASTFRSRSEHPNSSCCSNTDNSNSWRSR